MQQRISHLTRAGVAAVCMLVAASAGAVMFSEPVTMNSMVKWSDSIFQGRVVNKVVYPHPTTGYGMTKYTLECTALPLKGDIVSATGQRIDVTEVGGRVGDIVTVAEGAPVLSTGEQAVFFLYRAPQNNQVIFSALQHSVVKVSEGKTSGSETVQVDWPVTTYGKPTVGPVERNAKGDVRPLGTFLEDLREVIGLEAERAKAKSTREKAEREARQMEQEEGDEGGK